MLFYGLQVGRVSIHAPREGCDGSHVSLGRKPPGFNSRTPGGVRPRRPDQIDLEEGFNSRTPGGVRPRSASLLTRSHSFNSRTPGGVRLSVGYTRKVGKSFQFTHPGRGATDLEAVGR